MATRSGTPGPAWRPHLARAPTQLRVQGFPPSAPTVPRPRPTVSPLPLKWIRPLPADSNVERTISSVPRGTGGPAPSWGTGTATTHLLKQQPSDGPSADGGPAGGRGGGGRGHRGRGGGHRGTFFPRAQPSVPPPEAVPLDHREHELAREARARPAYEAVT